MKTWNRKNAAAAFFGGAARTNKYGARKTPCGAGHIHDSAKEARRCDDLRLLERAGQIKRLEQQPKFRLEVNGTLVCTYIGDFAYFTSGERVIEDVKSEITRRNPDYRIKKKLLEALHPGVRITEV